jgi:hypothetical protein
MGWKGILKVSCSEKKLHPPVIWRGTILGAPSSLFKQLNKAGYILQMKFFGSVVVFPRVMASTPGSASNKEPVREVLVFSESSAVLQPEQCSEFRHEK